MFCNSFVLIIKMAKVIKINLEYINSHICAGSSLFHHAIISSK